MLVYFILDILIIVGFVIFIKMVLFLKNLVLNLMKMVSLYVSCRLLRVYFCIKYFINVIVSFIIILKKIVVKVINERIEV